MANTASERSHDFLESAITLFNKKDYRGAIIQIRNALQQDPRNLSARVLFGRALLRLGDGAAAERQLWTARNAGADEALVIVPLGQALMLQRKYKLLLDEIRIGNRLPHVEAEIRFMRGQAHLERNDLGPAEKELAVALKLAPNDGKVLLGLARLRHIDGKIDQAHELIERALKADPNLADAWHAKGEVLRFHRDYANALKYYDRTIELRPDHIPARLARAAILIDTNRHEKALEDVLVVRKILPDNPQASYLHAMILTVQGKYEEASSVIRDVSGFLDGVDADTVLSSPRATLLRGIINYSRRRFDEAYTYLARYVQLVPHHAGARKMLGYILLQRKDSLSAAKMLEPAKKLAPDDVELLTLLGTAHLRNGNYEKAAAVFQQASRLAPDAATLKTHLAISQLAIGQREAAATGLEEVMEASPSIGRSDIILGMIKLRNGDPDGALNIAKRLAEKEPDNPFPSNLAGLAHMQKGKLAEARTSFEMALNLQPSFTPPQFNLAALDLKEGKVDQAKQRYLDILERRPTETRAFMGLSTIAEKAGDVETAIKWLEQLKKVNQKDIKALLRLVSLYQKVGRVREAQQIAYGLEEQYPQNLDVLEAKAGTEIAIGQTAKAIATFRVASYAAKEIPTRMIRIANQQIKLRDYDGARSSLKVLISQDPDFIPAHIALVKLEARAGGTEKALEMAEALRMGYPNVPVGDLLVGDLLVELSEYEAAEKAYGAGLVKQNGALFAIRLYQVGKKQGKDREALSRLARWNRENPGNASVMRVLATAYMAGDPQKAIEAHEAFLRDRPKDPIILNNLAVLYQERGDPRALETAERAYDLAPGSPVLMDTYGWILVQQGDAAGGLRYLREAQARASSRIEIRYHIAVALKQLGREDEARRELKDILKSRQEFSGRAAAVTLLEQLRKKSPVTP